MKALKIALLLLLVLFGTSILPGCGDDDSVGNDSSDDDDSLDDDSMDDDASDDDDDTTDDDSTDDDDDDDSTPSPYEGMAPAGEILSDIMSIASHMSTGEAYSRERGFEIEQASSVGFHFMRRGFYWNNIEGTDDVWTFNGYDTMVDLITDAGLEPIAMLTRGVSWAMPNGSPSDIEPAVFADFSGTVASRYADDIDVYEIWNEQNTSRFWAPESDPDHYGALLEAAFDSIHAADPDASVIFGGMSPLDDSHLLDPRGIWNFLVRVGEFHPDLCDFIDGVAIHPYTFLQQPGPEFSLDLGFYSFPDLRGALEEVRGMLGDLGCADLPIHLTEVGWPSLLIGNDRQAAFAARGLLLAASAGASSYCWYTFYDETPDSSIPTEDYFGLYELPDGVSDPDPKPAWSAITGLTGSIGPARYAGDLGAELGWESTDKIALVFVDDDGTWTIAFWNAGFNLDKTTDENIPVPPDAAGAWELLDQEGNQVDTGQVGDDFVAAQFTGQVHYLRFSK